MKRPEEIEKLAFDAFNKAGGIAYCSDFEGGKCCDSCHQDIDEGYGDYLEIEDNSGKVLARICCRKLIHLETITEKTTPQGNERE